MKKIYIILLLISACGFRAFAQEATLKGTLEDKADNSPLIGATVTLKNSQDSTKQYHALTDEQGVFTFQGVPVQAYLLMISYIGYQPLQSNVSLSASGQSLGTLYLSQSSRQLKEVKVIGNIPTTELHGDTTAYNASAFKTNPDATAEDLIKKMPGIQVGTDGSVKAQGEDVKKVLVDGKPFFGDDPTVALKNLPSEIIDKVEVFDKLSDQAQFSGFDDGNSSKTLNIVTKPNRRNGQFGKFFAGYGTDGRYVAGGNLNIFNHDQRFSIIGLSNNVNQQNFSFEDLLGVTGGGGRGGRRGGGGFRGGGAGNFLVGQQGGTNTTNSVGINYSDNWGKKITVSGSYFFNNSNNNTDESLNRQYFLSGDSIQVYNEKDISESHNYNHRLNFRFDYKIDSSNSLLIRPNISFQNYNSNSNLNGYYQQADSSYVSSTNSSTNNKNNGYNIGNDILYRHAFAKKGRTFSVNFHTEFNKNDGNSYQQSETDYYKTVGQQNESLNQFADKTTNGYNLSGNFDYTEPVGKNSQLQFSYNTSKTKSIADKETFNYNDNLSKYSELDTALSNKYNSDYITNSGGISYRFRKQQTFFNVGVNYQGSTLTGDQTFPLASKISKSFTNLLPNAMLRIRFSQSSNLHFFYRTSTNSPSINSLQAVIDQSNPLQLSTGNADLKQQYTHTFIGRYSNTNVQKSHTFFAMAFAQATQAYVSEATYSPQADSIIANGVTLNKGSQLTKPVNLNGYFNGHTFISYGFPLKFIKSNLNLNAGFNYSRTPGLNNNVENISNNYAPDLSAVIGSNISENVDFTISYDGTYNINKNTTQTRLNDNYYSSNASARLNLIFLKGTVFSTDLNYQVYNGLSSDYNQQYYLWNVSLAKKFLKNDRGEIKASVYDLLNQNNSISRTTTASYIEDSQTNVLHRFFMLTFTYNLRNFGQQKQQQGNDHPHMFMHPGGGRPPGPPPPGMF